MCKRVGIELEGGASFVDLFQKEFSIMHNQNTKQFKPGEYPEPCQMEIPNVEIFHVGLFLIVRIYQPNNPFFVKFEVSRSELLTNKNSYYILFRFKAHMEVTPARITYEISICVAVATFVTTVEPLFNSYPGLTLNGCYREVA